MFVLLDGRSRISAWLVRASLMQKTKYKCSLTRSFHRILPLSAKLSSTSLAVSLKTVSFTSALRQPLFPHGRSLHALGFRPKTFVCRLRLVGGDTKVCQEKHGKSWNGDWGGVRAIPQRFHFVTSLSGRRCQVFRWIET